MTLASHFRGEQSLFFSMGMTSPIIVSSLWDANELHHQEEVSLARVSQRGCGEGPAGVLCMYM